MKAAYDKKTSHHHFAAGDSVMYLVHFNPKRRGPYVIKDLIGTTNCSLTMKDGSIKHAHLNQLKPVERRHIEDQSFQEQNDDNHSTCENLDDLIMDVAESDYESAEEFFEEGEELGNDAWCGINEGNIIGPRTRSGGGGG